MGRKNRTFSKEDLEQMRSFSQSLPRTEGLNEAHRGFLLWLANEVQREDCLQKRMSEKQLWKLTEKKGVLISGEPPTESFLNGLLRDSFAQQDTIVVNTFEVKRLLKPKPYGLACPDEHEFLFSEHVENLRRRRAFTQGLLKRWIDLDIAESKSSIGYTGKTLESALD